MAKHALCKDCGMPSYRGCIALCESCADQRERAAEHTCENCGVQIPLDTWCCDACFPLFDGDGFVSGYEVNITEISRSTGPGDV